MDALDVLTREQMHVEALFPQLEATDDLERLSALDSLAFVLRRLIVVERQYLFPLIGEIALEPWVASAKAAHEMLLSLIADLEVSSTEEEPFAKQAALRSLITRHFDRQDASLFPLLRERLSAERLEAIGQKMERALETFDVWNPRVTAWCEPQALSA